MKNLIKSTAIALTLLASSNALAKAEAYQIDPAHSFIQFKVSHMGFSWLMGSFTQMEGVLNFDDKDISNSSISVVVNTASLESSHAKRNKHLKSDDYIDASKFPKAKFVSKSVRQQGDNILIDGSLTFHGVTKPLTIIAKEVGAGKSPWGDTRRGYEGTASFDRTSYGMKGKAGSKAANVELMLFIEAIK
jgi:polyisoprenoid-binding protein YceI